MGSQTELVPRPELQDDQEQTGGEWMVIVFDNDVNTVDEVIRILQQATGCTLEEASMETWEIHNLGRSIVHHAPEEECRRVAGIIRTIGIRVAVEKL